MNPTLEQLVDLQSKVGTLRDYLDRIRLYGEVANEPRYMDSGTFQMMEANLAEVAKLATQSLKLLERL